MGPACGGILGYVYECVKKRGEGVCYVYAYAGVSRESESVGIQKQMCLLRVERVQEQRSMLRLLLCVSVKKRRRKKKKRRAARDPFYSKGGQQG